MKPLKEGDVILIRHSQKLARHGHISLVGKTGTVTRVVMSGKEVVGVYADVRNSRVKRNYFIPMISVECPDYVNRQRTFDILKSTIL